MTAVSGLASSVAWTGFTGLFASPGYAKSYRFTLDMQGADFPTTCQDGAAVVATRGPLPYSWGGSITCRAPNTPASGYSGSVAWDAGEYATNVREWALNVNYGEKETTAFDDAGTGILFKTFIPLLASWDGSFAGYIDDTTALAKPTAAGIAAANFAALTLKLLDQGGSADDTLVGDAITTAVSADLGVETGGDFSYTFGGSGQLTAAGVNYGENSSGVFDDSTGVLVTPSAGSLVLTSAASRTYTGNAFPVGLSWRVGVTSGAELVIRFRGTGALTIG